MEKIKQFMYEGWVSKPAYIRAFVWFTVGLTVGALLK